MGYIWFSSIEVLFLQNFMNDLIRVKSKEIVKLQDIFKDIINQNVEKLVNVGKYSLSIVF